MTNTEQLKNWINNFFQKKINEGETTAAIYKQNLKQYKKIDSELSNNKFWNMYTILANVEKLKIDDEVVEILKAFKTISKSPYSNSFYNAENITWGSKPENSLRISDHWNFSSYGEKHCKTECGFTNGWAIGRYQNGFYQIIYKFEKN